jgi:hypothetical protein
MFNFNGFFNDTPGKTTQGKVEKKDGKEKLSEAEKNIAKQKEAAEKDKKSNQFWFKAGFGLVSGILKPLQRGKGQLSQIKPLAWAEDRKAAIADYNANRPKVSSALGGPDPEMVREHGWMLARKMAPGFKAPTAETKPDMPTMIHNRVKKELIKRGTREEEVEAMDPKKAWELLRQEEITEEIKEPEKEKVMTLEDMDEDLSVVQAMWDEAYDNMQDTLSKEEVDEVMNLTATTHDNPAALEAYLTENAETLKPEAKSFIEMSIQMKNFRSKSKDLLYEGIESKDPADNSMTPEEFAAFVDTGEANENTLRNIAEKIKSGKQMSREELSVYAEHGKTVESMLTQTESVN